MQSAMKIDEASSSQCGAPDWSRPSSASSRTTLASLASLPSLPSLASAATSSKSRGSSPRSQASSAARSPSLPAVAAAAADPPGVRSVHQAAAIYRKAWEFRDRLRPQRVAAPAPGRPASADRASSVGATARLRPASGALKQLLLQNVAAPGALHDLRAAQAVAIEALVKSLEPSRSPTDIVALLLKDVSVAGRSAAPTVDAMCAPSALPLGSPGPTEMVARVLQALHRKSQVAVGDIVAQILWRHRKAEALQEKGLKRIAESVQWAVADDTDPDAAPHIIELVDGVFKELTAAEGGRMSSPIWRKVAKMVQANPILNSRLRRTDVDRLYYGETHSRGEAHSGGITRRQFKSLLVQLAACMEVPPYMVMLAVGAHNGQAGSKALLLEEEGASYMRKRLSDE